MSRVSLIATGMPFGVNHRRDYPRDFGKAAAGNREEAMRPAYLTSLLASLTPHSLRLMRADPDRVAKGSAALRPALLLSGWCTWRKVRVRVGSAASPSQGVEGRENLSMDCPPDKYILPPRRPPFAGRNETTVGAASRSGIPTGQ